MRCLASLALALSVFNVALASPMPEPEAEPEAAAEIEERALPRFKLQVRVHDGQPAAKNRFDGLWLSTYHTGAGINDVVAAPEKKDAYPMILNGTRLAFIWQENAHPPAAGEFGMRLEYGM